MLNEHQINMLPERIYQRLDKMNTEYLTSIGEVIKKIGELRPTDVHRLQQMYNYGADVHKITNSLSAMSSKNIAEIYDIFDIVARENYNFAKPFYKAKGMPFIPFEENESLQKYVKAIAKQTAGEYVNLTQHTAFSVFAKDGKSIAPLFASNKHKVATSLSDTYTKVIDYAVSKVQLGGESYNKAMKDVIKALASSGIRTVDYASGYSRRLDSAVRQNIFWGVKECNQNTADMVGKEFGADGYEISYHSNPRPSHVEMGGRQYAIGRARTINGVHYPSFEKEAEPFLNEPNCLHFKFSILLGISQPAHDKDQLEQFKANDKKTFEFEGKKYTGYEGTQLQRRIENAAKNYKDLANIAKAAGNEVLRRETQEKINLLTSKYDKLSKVSGLPTKMERMQMKSFRSVKTMDVLKTPIAWISDNSSPSVAFAEYLKRVSSGSYALEKRHKFLLDKIPNSGEWTRVKSHQATIEDLAALTAYTKDEFALFSGKGYKYIFHGERKRWSLPNDAFKEICNKKMIWEGHSHPYPGDLTASPEDIKTLKLLTWQKKSTIIDIEGTKKTFTTLYADVINDMFGGG